MRINPESPDPEVVQRAAETVRGGGVVLYPTDTIYGLGCDPFNRAALDRIFEIKGRPGEKSVLVLIPGPEWVKRLARNVPSLLDPLLDRFWPGPLTVLLPAAEGLPPGIAGPEGKVGLRQPGVPFLLEWMKVIPGPLVSTSANRSGEPSPASVERLRELFHDQVDLFLEAGSLNQGSPSTILDLCVSPPRIVREGALAGELRRWLEEGSEAGLSPGRKEEANE